MAEEFTYQFLHFSCSKDHEASAVNVATTSDGNLMVKWYCLKCCRNCTALIPIEELIRNLPREPVTVDPEAFDREFLKDLKIS